MTKKLTAKTQELNPKLPQFSNSFSRCISIKPETTDLLLKKGATYSIFEISGSSNFDTELVCKVINDVIHDSYYQSDYVSPVQSMERAISETREKILQLSSDTLTSDPQGITLNFLSVVLWGNVLYVIQFGDVGSYFMKNNNVTPLEMISEGKFSSSSKIVDEDEVLILCTRPFEQSFPPEKLLASSISENDLSPNQTCLLMRLLIDTSLPEGEEVDFGLGDAVTQSQNRERVGKFVGGVKLAADKITKAGKSLTKALAPLRYFISSVVAKIIPKRKAVLLTRKITQLSGDGRGKSRGWLFLVVIAVLLAVSVFFTFRSSIFRSDSSGGVAVEVREEDGTSEEAATIEDRSRDEEFKVQRTSPEVFYDLKITDTESDPSEIQVVGGRLVIADRSSGKIYHSEIATPNFSVEDNTFAGIKSLAQSDGLLTFNDGTGFKMYSITNSRLEKSFDIEGLNITFPYAGYIYSISNDILTRSIEEEENLEGTLWGQNPEFRNATSMSIAFSVYILKEDGGLVNYSGGAKTGFLVSGLEKPFFNPVKVVTDIDFDNIYVADTGNRSIVVLNKSGELVRQYKNDDDGLWTDIRSITVSSDENTLFILDSSKVYRVSLEN